MLKYLCNISKQLSGIKSGMEKNSDHWSRMQEDAEYVQKLINEIETKNAEIEGIRNQLSCQYDEARKLKAEKQEIVKRLVKKAMYLHAEFPEKLNEYGIKKY